MRRRGFGFGRPAAGQNIPPALLHAHEQMESGNYQQAALAFEELAAAAEQRGGPRTPFLFIQAGRARLQNKQTGLALAHFRRGLELFASTGRYPQLYRAGGRITQELNGRGLEKEAQEITSILHSYSPAISESPTQRGPDLTRVLLPTHCPACGGPLRPDEADWLDAYTAECPFCGSPVRATG